MGQPVCHGAARGMMRGCARATRAAACKMVPSRAREGSLSRRRRRASPLAPAAERACNSCYRCSGRCTDRAKLTQKLNDASAVYHELLNSPDRGVPEALLKQAKCIVVIPHAVKGAIGYGARFGSGVMSCRNESGWSPPSFVNLGGGSIGL